ncbi:MAG: hypothetical protein DWB44_04970 [Chloroflexi bacterium]|nr:hypothetical protein [Chloroflexota bacterium]OQY79917.1 MAG: hypothetical protein B6D42_14035 [Anaerolineae bacterium UTCFX5]RIK22329.1 MAG: hypothetical protein DCC53_03670 [Chloroflexota bacterium]
MVRFAISETRVDRAYAFDSEGMLVEHAVLDSRSTAAPDISDYMHSLVRRALSTGQLVLSNNTFIDPSEAPSTNTSIKNLRIFVVIPIRGIGALFLDQPIGSGVVPRPTIDRMVAMCQRLADREDPESLTDTDIKALYVGP